MRSKVRILSWYKTSKKSFKLKIILSASSSKSCRIWLRLCSKTNWLKIKTMAQLLVWLSNYSNRLMKVWKLKIYLINRLRKRMMQFLNVSNRVKSCKKISKLSLNLRLGKSTWMKKQTKSRMNAFNLIRSWKKSMRI